MHLKLGILHYAVDNTLKITDIFTGIGKKTQLDMEIPLSPRSS